MKKKGIGAFLFQEWWENGTLHCRLSNPRSGEHVTFFPELGGTVSTLVFETGTGPLSVLRGYAGREDYNLDGRFRGLHLIPFANRILNGTYLFEGVEYRLPLNDREYHHAHHGFLGERAISPAGIESGPDGIAALLEYHYRGDYPGYPFPFDVRLRYSLSHPSRFSCHTVIINTGSSPMPVSPGWHPYYSLGGSMEALAVCLPPCRHVEINDRMMPTGNLLNVGHRILPLRDRKLDHLFVLPGNGGVETVELVEEHGGRKLRLWQETGPGKYNYLCVYTPPARDGVAIEPMTGNINAFNSGEGLIVLPPGGVFSGRFGVSLDLITRKGP